MDTLIVIIAVLIPLSFLLTAIGWLVVGCAFHEWSIEDFSGVSERFLVGGATMCVVGGLFSLVNLVMGMAGL